MSLDPNGAPPGYYYKAGHTAYVIDPAGTYSVGGATAPTTDPAGTFSHRGASAPTLAKGGAYIPVTGATSAAAELVDPAGTYSRAGASAPTTDPAGTYSGPGATAPTKAAAGTYIPVTGATSVAAQIVDPAGTYSGRGASAPTTDPAGTYSGKRASAPTTDPAGTYSGPGASAPTTDPAGTYSGPGASAPAIDPAGSYSLAGASAPTLAQPGYYVPTADASFERPVDPGYYTPYAGATAEILALPPVISGTVAGQSTPPGQPDTPFSSVTITDPNINTLDSLSIQLTGAGGTLADGAGFTGLTTTAPGVYLLSGTAAAITSELDALIFNPSGFGTTTFTLTDGTNVSGSTSASDPSTTVTVPSLDPNGAPAGYYYQPGATAYLIDPAGTYSLAGASAPTTDPAGTYTGPGASAPTPADVGTYIPLAGSTSIAAEILDPQGTYSGAGAASPTLADPGTYIPVTGATSAAAEIIDPAGTWSGAGWAVPTGDQPGYYSGAGASAPTPAAAGTYIPGNGATSAAAQIIDGAGAYSLPGASTPTADPGGTYSAAGASAPTLDPAGTYSSPYALNRLFLETSSVTPGFEVLSFNSVTAVANFYGVSSAEAGLATQFFADYGAAATMLFARYPVGGNRAHLFGADVSNLTLQQLQAINGPISVTSQGYVFSGTVNLSGVKSFAAAAVAIQAALNQNLPVAAVTTGDSIAPVTVSFTGSTSGLLLQVTSISSGSIEIGALISGAKVPAGTQINAQLSGTPGGVGLYSLYVPAGTIASETMTESYGVLTIGSVSSGTVADGEQVTDASGQVIPDTAIESNLSGSGAGSTWLVNNALTVSSENMTMTAAPLSVQYTAITGDTANRGYFSIQQNGDFNFDSSSLTYATGSAAAALGLTQAAGASLSPVGTSISSASAFLNNLVQTENGQFGSFQSTWQQLALESPQQTAALQAWAQSTGGQYQFLQNSTSNTPPAGASTPTIDPPGTWSGPGASLPTPAAPGAYIPVAGATSAAAQVVDPAGTYSGAGASAPTIDPAGTYSGAGATAPTPAAAGTYIKVTGATSAAAEKVDPAGTYSLAGASAPTTDPAGTFSPAGASAPILAAAGTYIPVAGATSSAAELVDPAGSYSLAGASAPTLAQPGYYVPTAGAGSETPVDPGYYTPYAGMTAEILALPPTISGTAAGQSTPSGQSDTPFASVTITDPNIATSDSVTIQLTGLGGALTDGAGFNGLRTSGPGAYILSGTAAAITSELDALIYTPAAGSGTTTFTLTDTTSVGTSASDASTTVTVNPSGPLVVSVATFLADQPSLDQTPGGFDILDTASAISTSLDQLNDPNIDLITILGNGQVAASVRQLTTDATAIGKLQNPNASPVLLAINDTAADVQAGLSTLTADTGEIASITASNGPVVVSAATFLADQPVLDKIVGGFAIADTAFDVAQDLDALNADTNIPSIALTDGGTPTLALSIGEALNDTLALSEITSPHATVIADSAPASITITQAQFLSGENISVAGAPVIATGTVSTMAILAKIISSLLVSQGYTLAVLDTAANIGALTIAQINNLSVRGVLLLQASDTSVPLNAGDAALLEAAGMTVTAPSGSFVTVTDTRANLNAMSATTIAGLPAIGVSGIVSTTGPVTISVAQALALEGANLGITGPNGASVSVTLSDLASTLAGLTPNQIAALPATGVSAIAVSNAANLVLSVAQATALETSGASLTLQSGDSVIVSDSAANIQSLTVGQIAGLSALDVTQISATDTTVLLTVAKAQALEAAGIPVSAPSGQTDLLSDTAVHLGGLTVSQINGLTAIGVTGVVVSSAANLTLTVAQAQALEANNLDVTPLTGRTVTISDTAADIATLSAGQLAGLPTIGVTGLVSTDANISYTPDQTAAILSSGLNVSASGSYTVTENFANGNYSVYRGGQLIQQKSVNPDGSYDIANFGVTGLGYSSYEDIYNSTGTLVAEARDMTNGSGNLILSANGLTITTASGSESVTTGSDTFAINPHVVQTVTATNMQSETFVYGPGFGQDTLTGFLETSSSHDLLQFSASMFDLSPPVSQSQQSADAQYLLNFYASGTTNTVISVPDPQADTLTINNHSISSFQNNLQDFKFT